MANGGRIRIVTEREYRIMSPPRRPRGEKPRTTIRYLQRQIANMQMAQADLWDKITQKDKQIAAADVELSEAADAERLAMARIEQLEHSDRLATVHLRDMSKRLSFLEGYYEKSKEILPHDPAKTIRGGGAGNTGRFPDGSQNSEEERFEAAARGAIPGTGGEIRGIRPDNSAYTNRRPVAEFEIGVAHDATDAGLERHRR